MKAHEPKRSILLKFVSYAMLTLAKNNYLTVIPNIAMSLYDIIEYKYVCIFTYDSVILHDSTMRMLTSPWRALYSDNAAA